MNLTWPIKIY